MAYPQLHAPLSRPQLSYPVLGVSLPEPLRYTPESPPSIAHFITTEVLDTTPKRSVLLVKHAASGVRAVIKSYCLASMDEGEAYGLRRHVFLTSRMHHESIANLYLAWVSGLARTVQCRWSIAGALEPRRRSARTGEACAAACL